VKPQRTKLAQLQTDTRQTTHDKRRSQRTIS
jgi:hypothetical protein